MKGGKVIESFMGLSVQICRSMDAKKKKNSKALDAPPLKLETFVQKLKKILEIFMSPTTDFPSIRRYTLELMTWMVKTNSSYRDVLLQCGVYEQLNEVKRTARKLESSKLFHCGVDVLDEKDVEREHGILCISSLANELREQLQLCPNFVERYYVFRHFNQNIINPHLDSCRRDLQITGYNLILVVIIKILYILPTLITRSNM